MALYLQSERYQTCYFLGKSVAYVQIPMIFSFPFGQYEEKNIYYWLCGHIYSWYKIFFYYVIFLIKILKVTSLKTHFFPYSHIKKKKACTKDA